MIEGDANEERRRFYVCIDPSNEGFMDGYRPLMGLDGCHLKRHFVGILLAAVGTDPNGGMYSCIYLEPMFIFRAHLNSDYSGSGKLPKYGHEL